jgi:hypothetical protein
VLDAPTIQSFHNDEKLRRELHGAFERMLAFFGFAWKDGAVVHSADYAVRAANWLTPGNHNHLRLTRMMRSLRILGLDAEAQALWKVLQALYETEDGQNSISQRTYNFWTRAANEPPKPARTEQPATS